MPMIKRHRLKKGLTRREVAKRLNMSLHEYDHCEKRRRSLTFTQSMKLAAILTMPVILLE